MIEKLRTNSINNLIISNAFKKYVPETTEHKYCTVNDCEEYKDDLNTLIGLVIFRVTVVPWKCKWICFHFWSSSRKRGECVTCQISNSERLLLEPRQVLRYVYRVNIGSCLVYELPMINLSMATHFNQIFNL